MSKNRNEFLDHGSSGESEEEDGYDSEAGEAAKGARALISDRSAKRRKVSYQESDSEDLDEVESAEEDAPRTNGRLKDEISPISEDEDHEDAEPSNVKQTTNPLVTPTSSSTTTLKPKSKKSKEKETKPGVVYLSSLPPYLKPSALRNLLTQRGFEPITRLFLTPASKAKAGSKKNSRQLYTEGWIEFANKKTAKLCAEALNTQIVGGNKRGFYYDDIWNMKYLRGMGWSELMSGIREEKREQEGRRDEERRTIAKETKRFIEGVEEGRKVEGMKRKRSEKSSKAGGDNNDHGPDKDVKRTWRQYEVKGKSKDGTESKKQQKISDDAREVLGKIF